MMSLQNRLILAGLIILAAFFIWFAARHPSHPAETTPAEITAQFQLPKVPRDGFCLIEGCGPGLMCIHNACREDSGQHVPNG